MTPSLRAAALAIAAVTAGCAPGPQAVDRRGCAVEAVLLEAGVELRAAPDARAAPRLRLAPGQPVYLCGEPVRGFRPVLHPIPGTPARCSEDASACQEGWMPADTPVGLAG